jgi:hypothetical protein
MVFTAVERARRFRDGEEIIVALAADKEKLSKRILELESIAPRKSA